MPPDHEPAGVRFFVRVDDVMLPGVRAFAGWTVVEILPDPQRPGVQLVEVEDPHAPPAAAGLICDPTFTRQFLADGGEHEPGDVWISDYGIPPATP